MSKFTVMEKLRKLNKFRIAALFITPLVFCFSGALFSVSAQDGQTGSAVEESEKITLYVQTGCPHCNEVEKFIEENELEDHFEIYNISTNDQALNQYNSFWERVDAPISSRGVPIIVYGNDEFVSGDTFIIDYLKERFEIEDEFSSDDAFLLIGGAVIVAFVVGYGIVSAGNARKKS